jgi:hypothetical protein
MAVALSPAMRAPRLLHTAVPVALVALLCATAGSASAGRRSSYRTDKGFGLGIMLGAPSGLSGKYFLDRSPVALAFGVGTYQEFYYHHGTELHMDVLWHPAVLASSPGVVIPFYLGVGGRVLEHGDYVNNGMAYVADTHIGVRVPFGIAFDLRRAPIDIFAELVPVFDFAGHHHYGHELDLTGAFGLRYYF